MSGDGKQRGGVKTEGRVIKRLEEKEEVGRVGIKE